MRIRRPKSALATAAGHAASSIVQTLRLFRNDPYIKALGGLVLVSTVALTLADYVFKSTVAQTVAPAHLGTFFASFYMILNVLALGAQLVLAGWLLRVLGLHRTLWVLPAFVFLGAAGVALGGGLLAALLLKGADGTLRYSLHRTGTELLFVPLPDSLRARAKPVIDVVGQRGGQALASLADPGRDHAEPRQHRARGGGGRALRGVDRLGRGPEGPLPRPVPRRRCAKARCARAGTCPPSTSARWRRCSPRSTAVTTPR